MPAPADHVLDERQTPYVAAFEKFAEQGPQRPLRRSYRHKFANYEVFILESLLPTS